MGGGKKQTTNSTETASTQTTLPEWMTAAGQQGFQNAAATAAANPVAQYTGQLSPGMAAGQTQAGGMAQQGSDADAARALTAGAAFMQPQNIKTQATGAAGYNPTMQGTSPTVQASYVATPDNFGAAQAAQYMSPYTADVQRTTLDEMRRQNGIEMAGMGDAAQAAHAYGGTRQGVAESETRGRQNQNMMSYLAQSNADAYNNAQSQFERDRAAQMTAAGQNQGADMSARTSTAGFLDSLLGRNASAANAASEFGAQAANTATQADAERALAAAKANQDASQTAASRMLQAGGQIADIGHQQIGDLSATGAVDQNTQAAQDALAYQEYLRMQNAPLAQQATLMDILSGTPRNTSTTGTTTGQSTQTQSGGGLLNTLLGAAQIGASIFGSDRRLKRDIALDHRRDDGLGIYRYRYIWDDDAQPLRIGVMADEVSRIIPMAMGPFIAGYHTVNYARVGALN